jgi:spermidine synthase
MEHPMTQKAWTTVRAATQYAGRMTREASRTRLNQLAAIFFVSGVAGLVFELLWVRVLSLTFGVTSYAISTVLAGFMAGLALGSAGAGRLADRLKDPLRAYAFAELLIGVTGVLTLVEFQWLQSFYVAVHPRLADSPALLTMIRLALALVIMLVPTTLMGATLPILLRSSLLRTSHTSTHLSLLYAVNTFGAIVGCLITPFYLIGGLGIRHSILLAACLNLTAAGLALWLRWTERINTETRRHGEGQEEIDGAEAAAQQESSNSESPSVSPCLRVDPYPAATRSVVFWAIGVSGLLSLAYEVVWARLLATLFDATVYSFAIMLAVYLLGLAVGSAAVKPLMRRPLRWPAVLAGVEFGIGVASLFSIFFLTRYGWSPPGFFSWLLDWFVSDVDLQYTALVSFVALFPATFLMGASFPIAAEVYTAGLPEVGRRVGSIYAVNVFGSIFGSLLGGFVLLPLLGVERSMKLLVIGNALLGLAVLVATATGRLRSAMGTAALLGLPVLGASAVVAAGGLKRLAPGVAGSSLTILAAAAALLGLLLTVTALRQRPRELGWTVGAGLLLAVLLYLMPPLYDTLFASRFPDQRVLWREEGIENTVTIAQGPDQRVMYLNGHHQANDSEGMVRYHRLIGHLPALLHPDPRRALVIGLGGGATPGALTQHPELTVECVELSPSVVGGARFFGDHNNHVLDQPNLVMRVDDGRNHLLLTDQKYDIITADVIMPHHAGAGNLYSVEYYKLCKKALAPGGLMCQWIWKNSRSQYQMMIRTFVQAFPYVTFWEDGTLMIGSNQPITISRAALARKFQQPQTRASLLEVKLQSPEQVLKMYTGNRDEVVAYVGDGPIISDDRPLIEYFRSSQEMQEVVTLGRIQRDLREYFRNRTPPVVE